MLWSEHQAELLRRLAAGERLNERPDWANLIDEVESVGRSELHAVESLLVQALTRLPDTIDGVLPRTVPADCPLTLDGFLPDP